MIKNIVFDLGGVVFEIDKNQAVRRFNEVGFEDAASYLDSFAQVGIFGDLESGKITAEQFRLQLSELAGKQLSMDDCAYGWQGYVVNLPQRNLDKFIELRHGIDYYFNALYLSYEMGIMKPERRIFEMMLKGENAKPEETVFIDDSAHNVQAAAALGIHVLQPDNGANWHDMLETLISQYNPQAIGFQ